MSAKPWKYPQLWEGCVGAWCPSYQRWPSATVQNYARRANHGTLTNMDAATDWTSEAGRMSLDLDGSNDYVTMTSCPQSEQLTVMLWIYLRAVTNFAAFVAASDSSIGTNGHWVLGIGSAQWRMSVQTPTTGLVHAAGTGSITTGRWFHVSGIYSGSAVSLWENAVQLTSTAANATSVNTRTTTNFGSRDGTSNYVNALIDDVRIYNCVVPESSLRLLARRRGIAFDSTNKRTRVASAAAPVTSSSNLLLLGVG